MQNLLKYVWVLFLFAGCIGTDIVDDFVPEEILITNQIDSIQVGSTYRFEAVYRNTIGVQEAIPLMWQSSAPDIISVDNEGTAVANAEGKSIIRVTGNNAVFEFELVAGERTSTTITERTAQLRTVSSYPLSGTATLATENGQLVLKLAGDFTTTSALPGLYVYLTNNTNSTANALELGKVTSFSGAQTYAVPGDETGLFDYKYVLFFCKPFVVPVGNGELKP